MSLGSRHSLWFETRGKISIKESLIPTPGPGQVLIQSKCSAISAGTELLAYRGLLPKDQALDESIPGMRSAVRYPMKYGYSIVGSVVDKGANVDELWLGKSIFAFHPHESHFLAHLEEIVCLPENIHDEDAVFLANMETAVSLVLDGVPMIGEKVLVMGLGVVGQLLTSVLQLLPLAKLSAVDPVTRRRLAVHNADAMELSELDQSVATAGDGYDLVYETSGSPEALRKAINVTRYHGRVIVASWYGSKNVNLDLGSHFHRSKVSLYASQVSKIDPSLTGRWNKNRRMALALEMLNKVNPRNLITHQYSVQNAADAYKLLDKSRESIQAIITY